MVKGIWPASWRRRGIAGDRMLTARMRSEISKVVRANGCLNIYSTFQLVVLGILVDRRAWQVRLGESLEKWGIFILNGLRYVLEIPYAICTRQHLFTSDLYLETNLDHSDWSHTRNLEQNI